MWDVGFKVSDLGFRSNLGFRASGLRRVSMGLGVYQCNLYEGFPKLGGTFDVGVPIIRIIDFWSLYWRPLILGNYHMLGSKVNS